jgi:hypothetical protein
MRLGQVDAMCKLLMDYIANNTGTQGMDNVVRLFDRFFVFQWEAQK